MRIGRLTITPWRFKPQVMRHSAGTLRWRNIEWLGFEWRGKLTRETEYVQSLKQQSQTPDAEPGEQG